jgi:hypothetical protein
LLAPSRRVQGRHFRLNIKTDFFRKGDSSRKAKSVRIPFGMADCQRKWVRQAWSALHALFILPATHIGICVNRGLYAQVQAVSESRVTSPKTSSGLSFRAHRGEGTEAYSRAFWRSYFVYSLDEPTRGKNICQSIDSPNDCICERALGNGEWREATLQISRILRFLNCTLPEKPPPSPTGRNEIGARVLTQPGDIPASDKPLGTARSLTSP